jgi:predicted nucleic acid-binding protein
MCVRGASSQGTTLMRGKYFLDTNIFVYAFDSTAPEKKALARRLIMKAVESGQGVISFQVAQEFFNVATRKFKIPFTVHDGVRYLQSVFAPLCEIFPSIEFYQEALEIQERWQLAYYDSMIVTAALNADCEILYSEDLQHGFKIRNHTIENPFLSKPSLP